MSTAPTYVTVDPTAFVVPTDNAAVPAYLAEIQDVLVAINHNLTLYIQTNGADLQTINTTLGNHDQSLTNLDSLMVQALAGVGNRGGILEHLNWLRRPNLTVQTKTRLSHSGSWWPSMSKHHILK
jgi:hypothetical protein